MSTFGTVDTNLGRGQRIGIGHPLPDGCGQFRGYIGDVDDGSLVLDFDDARREQQLLGRSGVSLALDCSQVAAGRNPETGFPGSNSQRLDLSSAGRSERPQLIRVNLDLEPARAGRAADETDQEASEDPGPKLEQPGLALSYRE